MTSATGLTWMTGRFTYGVYGLVGDPDAPGLLRAACSGGTPETRWEARLALADLLEERGAGPECAERAAMLRDRRWCVEYTGGPVDLVLYEYSEEGGAEWVVGRPLGWERDG